MPRLLTENTLPLPSGPVAHQPCADPMKRARQASASVMMLALGGPYIRYLGCLLAAGDQDDRDDDKPCRQ